MAWTDPRTWIVGEVVTAAMLNTHVRDNLNATRTVSVTKTADESVSSNAVEQDDDELFFALGANERWAFQCVMPWGQAAAAGGGFRFAFSGPAGMNGGYYGQDFHGAGSAIVYQSALTNVQAIGSPGDTQIRTTVVWGAIRNGGTAGTFRLKWAQQTSDADATTLKIDAQLVLWRAA